MDALDAYGCGDTRHPNWRSLPSAAFLKSGEEPTKERQIYKMEGLHVGQIVATAAATATPREHPALCYWKSFFDFSYYGGFCSYRIVFDATTGEWVIKRNAWQKACCFIGTLLVVDLVRIKLFLNEYHSAKDVTFYLEIFNDLALIVYLVGYNYTMWVKADSVLRVFNFIQESQLSSPEYSPSPTPVSSVRKKWRTLSIRLLPGVFVLYAMVTQLQNIPDLSLDTFEQFEVLAQNLLFLSAPPKIPALNFCACLVIFYFGVMCFLMDFIFIVNALFYRDLVKGFAHEFQERISVCRSDSDVKSMLASYQRLKQSVILINEAVGWANMAFSVGIPEFIWEIMGVVPGMSSLGVFTAIRIVGITTYIGIGFVAVASSHQKIGLIYNWLIDGHKNVTAAARSHFHVFLHDLSFNNIGMTVAEGCYVTYGFLGSALGLIVTFMVLLLQFQGPGSNSVFQTKASIILW